MTPYAQGLTYCRARLRPARRWPLNRRGTRALAAAALLALFTTLILWRMS